MNKNKLFCCGCNKDVLPMLVNGKIIYPHRKDLYHKKFYLCRKCDSYVGVHEGTENHLGCLATKEIMNARKHIHKLIDPIWEKGKIKRSELYKRISNKINRKYHTANIRSVDEAREIYIIAKEIIEEIQLESMVDESDYNAE